MEATDILRREHDQILRVLHVAALAADRLMSGEDPPSREDLEGILEFLREFADGTHHAKEEKCLFPWMAGQGFPQGQGPLVCMNRLCSRHR
jgi:hemerythrin-like domain-containing protein